MFDLARFRRLWPPRFRFLGTLTFKVVMIFLLIITIATSSVSIMSYFQAVGFVDRQNDVYTQNVAESISREIDRNIEEIDRIGRIVLGNPNVQRIMVESQSPNYTSIQRLNDIYLITDLILSFTSVRDSMMIQLYDKNLEVLYSGPVPLVSGNQSLLKSAWFEANREAVNSRRTIVIPPGAVDDGLPRQLFGVVRSLQRIDGSEVIGYISVTSDLRRLQDVLGQSDLFAGEAHIEVSGPQGIVLLDSKNSTRGQPLQVKDSGRLVVSHVSEQTGWRTTISTAKALGSPIISVADTRNYLVLFSSLVILATLALAVLLSNQVFKPIRTIVQAMDSVRQGSFEIKLEEKGLDYEVGHLYSGFNLMLREISSLIRRLYDEQLLTRSAKVEALQYQINPHFVYNTLQTIEAVGEVYSIPEVQTMAQSLGKMLRYNVRGGSIVELREEIEQIATYFSIEKIRYPDKLDCQLEVPEELARCKILKFILQPIVENCVLHGFKNMEGRGIVTIRAERDAHGLALYVSDNGRGISSQRLASLNEQLQAISESSVFEARGDYVGVVNVHMRIVNHYGNGYGLRYTSNENLGTTAILSLPLVLSEPDAALVAAGG